MRLRDGGNYGNGVLGEETREKRFRVDMRSPNGLDMLGKSKKEELEKMKYYIDVCIYISHTERVVERWMMR